MHSSVAIIEGTTNYQTVGFYNSTKYGGWRPCPNVSKAETMPGDKCKGNKTTEICKKCKRAVCGKGVAVVLKRSICVSCHDALAI